MPLSRSSLRLTKKMAKFRKLMLLAIILPSPIKIKKPKNIPKKMAAKHLYDQGLTVKCTDKTGNEAAECLKKYPNIT